MGLQGLTGKDTVQPATPDESSKYRRSLNMCEQYRKSVKEIAAKIDNLIKKETSGMTINAKEDRKFNIESKVDTITQLSNEYKKYHYD